LSLTPRLPEQLKRHHHQALQLIRIKIRHPHPPRYFNPPARHPDDQQGRSSTNLFPACNEVPAPVSAACGLGFALRSAGVARSAPFFGALCAMSRRTVSCDTPSTWAVWRCDNPDSIGSHAFSTRAHEYDAAQERGEVAKRGGTGSNQYANIPDGNISSIEDIEKLTTKAIFLARQIRDPGSDEAPWRCATIEGARA
jgi:hypothetical protein